MTHRLSTRITSLVISFIALFQFGCYNTYRISLEELQQIQESDGATFKTIKSEDGKALPIVENTRVRVYEKSNGKKHAISPFNFTLNQMQLVAPDQNLILPRTEVDSAEVKLINPMNTWLTVAGVAAALVGVYFLIPEPNCEGAFCNKQ
jgi:hypothetical protein